MDNSSKGRKVFNIVLAIAIAFGLWLYVINVENPTGTVTLRGVPVKIEGKETLEEKGLMVTDLSAETMNVKLSGRRKVLMNLDKDNVSLAVDVTSVSYEGQWDLTCRAVYPSYVSTSSVSISGWSNPYVTVTVEEKATKQVPVRGQFIGTEAEGAVVESVSVDPSTVSLEGPSSVLSSIQYALVQVGGEEVSETLVEEAEAVFMGQGGVPVVNLKNVTASAIVAQVTVTIQMEDPPPGGNDQKDSDEDETIRNLASNHMIHRDKPLRETYFSAQHS